MQLQNSFVYYGMDVLRTQYYPYFECSNTCKSEQYYIPKDDFFGTPCSCMVAWLYGDLLQGKSRFQCLLPSCLIEEYYFIYTHFNPIASQKL